MSAEEPRESEEQCADLLAACHEALASGATADFLEGQNVPPELRPRLERAVACLQRLERLWPSRPVSAGPPGATVPPLAHVRPAGSEAQRLTISGYEILEGLGRGGMGVVYKARQVSLNRLVALKMVLAGSHAAARDLARFRTEAEAVAHLQHPNIVQIHELGEHNGLPYFSLEFVAGGSLAQKLGGTPQPAQPAAELVETLARAVHVAHEHGVIHRDLKPANILLAVVSCQLSVVSEERAPSALTTDNWQLTTVPKIADFGLAKYLEDDRPGSAPGGLTQTGTVLGTPSYMAPEQAAGRLPDIGPATDVYALGTILYEMLTGRPPFQGMTPLDTVQQVQVQEAVPPRRLQPKVPLDLQTICLKCLQKEPRKRYGSALALAEDLARFRRGEAIWARPVHPLERLGRWCGRNPVLAGMTAAVAVLLVVLALQVWRAAVRLQEERDAAVRSQERAERAEAEATHELWQSYIDQARLVRTSQEPDRRGQGLAFLAQAAAIDTSLDVRNEVIACLALPDLRLIQRWEGKPHGTLAVAADAQLEHYARSDQEGAVSIRRVRDDQEVSRLEGPPSWAWVRQFSPDGRFLAVVHAHPSWKNQLLYIWDWQRRQRVLKIPLGGAGLGFRRDSRQLAAGLEDGSIGLYELPSGALGKRLQAGPLPREIAYDPDGRRLAVSSLASWDVEVRDLQTNAVVTLGHPREVRGIAWRADGTQLATACGDGHIFVWDAATGQQLATLQGHEHEVSEVAFQPRGDLLASTAWDDTLRLWDPSSRKEVAHFSGGEPSLLHFGPAGGRLAFKLDSRIEIWQAAPSRAGRTLHGQHGGGPGISCVDFSPRHGWLASASREGVRLWHAATGKPIAFLNVSSSTSAFFDPEGHSLITTSDQGWHRWPIRVAKDKDEEKFQIGPPHRLGLGRTVGRMGLSLDGRTLAAIRADGRAVVLHGDDPSRQVVLGKHPNLAWIAVSPRGRWVATGTWKGSGVKVWDADNGRQVWEWPDADDAQIAFSPDDRWLVTSTAEGYRFWEVGSWRADRTVRPTRAAGGTGAIAFTPDGKMQALAVSATDVRLCDTATGQEIATLTAPDRGPPVWLSFSPDGSQLAVACANHAIQLWDLRLIRTELAAMHLDWDLPAYPPAGQDRDGEPAQIEVLVGELAPPARRP
jgi:serine/threonine protein kinase/WD40 repeat protein